MGADMIRMRGVSKSFGASHVVSGMDIDFANGQFTALLGRSGSGKTSLLRLMAGLEFPDSGSIEIDAAVTSGCRISVTLPVKRGS